MLHRFIYLNKFVDELSTPTSCIYQAYIDHQHSVAMIDDAFFDLVLNYFFLNKIIPCTQSKTPRLKEGNYFTQSSPVLISA